MFYFLIIFMNLLYAGTPTFMKMASAELSPFQIVFLRHSLAMLAFLPFFLAGKQKWMRGRDFLRILLGAFFAFTFASALQIIGVGLSQAAEGSFILAMEPVVTICLALLFLKEKMNPFMTAGLWLAMTGFVFLSSSSFQIHSLTGGHWIGNLLFLLAVLGESSFPIFLKPLLKRYPPYLVAFYCLLASSFYMLPFQNGSLLQTLPHAKPMTWIAMLYLSLGCSFLACLLWLTSLKRFSVSVIATSWFLQPVLGCLFALVLLKEPITPNILWGGCFIFGALILTAQKKQPTWQQLELKFETPAQTILRIRHPLWVEKATYFYKIDAAKIKRETENFHSAIYAHRRFPNPSQHTYH